MVREQGGSDEEMILSQVQTCNEMIAILKDSLGQEECDQLKLDEQGEVLTYIYSKINHIRAFKDDKVTRPTSPLSHFMVLSYRQPFVGSDYIRGCFG